MTVNKIALLNDQLRLAMGTSSRGRVVMTAGVAAKNPPLLAFCRRLPSAAADASAWLTSGRPLARCSAALPNRDTLAARFPFEDLTSCRMVD